MTDWNHLNLQPRVPLNRRQQLPIMAFCSVFVCVCQHGRTQTCWSAPLCSLETMDVGQMVHLSLLNHSMFHCVLKSQSRAAPLTRCIVEMWNEMNITDRCKRHHAHLWCNSYLSSICAKCVLWMGRLHAWNVCLAPRQLWHHHLWWVCHHTTTITCDPLLHWRQMCNSITCVNRHDYKLSKNFCRNRSLKFLILFVCVWVMMLIDE